MKTLDELLNNYKEISEIRIKVDTLVNEYLQKRADFDEKINSATTVEELIEINGEITIIENEYIPKIRNLREELQSLALSKR